MTPSKTEPVKLNIPQASRKIVYIKYANVDKITFFQPDIVHIDPIPHDRGWNPPPLANFSKCFK
jgi:hypothetical protein